MFPSISGAFRSLHCLIYKVHVPRGTFTILALTCSFVKSFFQVFSNSFTQNRHPLEPDSSSILPDTQALVKYFFSFFRRPLRLDHRAPDSLITILRPSLFVNTFFDSFHTFSHHWILCPIPGKIPPVPMLLLSRGGHTLISITEKGTPQEVCLFHRWSKREMEETGRDPMEGEDLSPFVSVT